MMLIVGLLVVFGSVLGGYLPHGSIEVLMQPLEVLIIGGAAFGGFLIANPMPVVQGVAKSMGKLFKGEPYKKSSYVELLLLLYTLFRLMKQKGALAIEAHIEAPHDSDIFKLYPGVEHNHHALDFLCDYLRLLTIGVQDPHLLESLMDEDIKSHHHELATIASSVTTMADGLPAFGIVAAVLGVIVTMGSITEPPEVLGHHIGAALVGTFLGILLAYGVVGPVGAFLTKYADAETKFLECIKAGLIAHVQGSAPIVSIEFSRKVLDSRVRPSFGELQTAVESAPKA